MCVCASIRPGTIVSRPRSITSTPAGGALVPTETMRSLSMTITAFAMLLPEPSTTVAARIALVAANDGDASASTQHNAVTEPRRHEEDEGPRRLLCTKAALRASSCLRDFVV